MDDLSDIVTAQEPDTPGQEEKDRFQRLTAVWIAVLAVLLAVSGLGGENTAEAVVFNNILASDSFAWYQAKNIRQTAYELAADDLQFLLESQRVSLPPEQVQELEARLADYQAAIARYDSEPDPDDPDNPLKGEGKRELLAQALHYQAARDQALVQDPNFDYASVLFQIAIVLASVAIIASSRLLVGLSGALGVVGTLLALNGFFAFFVLPF